MVSPDDLDLKVNLVLMVTLVLLVYPAHPEVLENADGLVKMDFAVNLVLPV